MLNEQFSDAFGHAIRGRIPAPTAFFFFAERQVVIGDVYGERASLLNLSTPERSTSTLAKSLKKMLMRSKRFALEIELI